MENKMMELQAAINRETNPDKLDDLEIDLTIIRKEYHEIIKEQMARGKTY